MDAPESMCHTIKVNEVYLKCSQTNVNFYTMIGILYLKSVSSKELTEQ